MLQTRPDACDHILLLVYDALDSQTLAACHLVFIRFLYLNPDIHLPAAIGDLTNHLLAAIQLFPDSSHQVVNLLLDIVKASPTLTAAPVETDVIQILEGLTRSVSCFSEAAKIDLILCVLAAICDAQANQQSIVRPLRLLHRLCIRTMPISLSFVVMIISGQLLLSTSDYVREAALFVSILHTFLSAGQISFSSDLARAVVSCLVYPITSLVSELSSQQQLFGSDLDDLKNTAFSVLEHIQRIIFESESVADDDTLEIVLAEIAVFENEQSSNLVSWLSSIRKYFAASTGIHLSSYYSTDPSPSVPLFLTAFLFHKSEATRISAIDLLKSIISDTTRPASPNTSTTTTTTPQSQFALSVLPLILYTLKQDPSPEVQLQILTTLIPALVTGHSDPYVTTSVLRVISQFLGPLTSTSVHSSTATTDIATPFLSAVGIRVLLQLWKAQPKIWSQLKSVLNGWVVRKRNRSLALKRFGKKGDGVGKGDVDLEVAVVVSIHEICKMKPKEHGEDLLPMAISILELDAPGGADTLVLSKRLAMDVINMCIQVDITDPRAIWGVHHAQYAKQMLESPSPVAESLWIQLFAFFKLVPMKSEDTEVYQQFKHDILTTYILRSLSITAPTDDQADDLVTTITKPQLIKNISPKIKCAAFDALASFPPPELYPLIPLPVDFLTTVLVPEAASLEQVSPQVLESLSGGPSSLLTGLLFHEIDNMRRAVFKALATDMGVNRNALEASGGGEGDAADKELGKARRALKDLGSEGREKWVLGKSAAAVRSGLAAASLFLPVSLLADDLKAASSSFDPSTATLPRLTAYKDLVNGLRDLSISDHPLIRAEAVTVWIAFWMSRLRALVSVTVQDQTGENNKDPMTSVEWLFKNSLQELEKRLREAKQPVPCANVIFSLVGLVSAASSLSVPDASENVSRMISLLISEYGRKFAVSSSATADQNFNTSELQKSDEVQFAVCLGLSYLARLLFPTDEVSFGVIISQLQNELMFSVSDDSQSGFAAGYGATIVLHSLVLSPSPNVPLISQLTSLVSENLLDPTNISSTAFCGLSMGLSNCLRDLKEFADIESVAELNVDGVLNAIVDRFLLSVEEEEGEENGEMESSAVSLLIGDCWIASASVWCGCLDDVKSNAVESALEALVSRSEKDPSLTICLGHLQVNINRILVSKSPTSNTILSIVLDSLSRLGKSNIPSATRISIALGLTPLLGIDFLTPVYPNASLYKQTIESIHSILQSSPEPKVGRILGWIQGRIFNAFEKLYDTEMASQIDGFLMSSRGSGGGGGKNGTMTASKKKDPIDYRRLNVGSSFLRAAFDTLNEVCNNSSTGHELLTHNHIPVAKMILVGFVNVGKKQRLETKKNANFGLPVVNWTNILTVCFASGDLELKRLCFELCVLHASHTSAKSLVDFFVAKMSTVVDAGAGGDGDFVVRREFAFGKDGVGKLLELAGLYSGDGSADSCITVAPSKVLEILQSVVYFVYFDGSVKDMIKLSEVFDSHLNGPRKAAGLPNSLVKLKTDILNLLCEAYLSLPESPDSLHQITVIRRLVHTIFISETPQTTALLLQHILNPEAWNSKHIWALFHCLEFTDTEAPWILTSHITRLFVNKDHLVVRILQFLVSQQEFQFDARPVSCVSATLTYLRYSITSKPKTDLIENLLIKLAWVVRYLDVLIIACAGGNGSGVDYGWAKCLSGALLVLGSDSRGLMKLRSNNNNLTDLVCVNEVEWDAIGKMSSVSLVDLMMENEDTRVWKLRSQIVKRLLRLMECTITQSEKEKRNLHSSPRIVIGEETRQSIRNVLLRVRDFDAVCDGWLEVVGELCLK